MGVEREQADLLARAIIAPWVKPAGLYVNLDHVNHA